MRAKGNTLATATTYAYSDPRKPDHAPSAVTQGGVTTPFTYDPNGNMLSGLGGKIMEYDGENRPLSVTYLGKKTCYVYGVDGKRLKKVEGLAPATLCTALPPSAAVTTYFGPVEVRNWLGVEQVLTYPQPSIKLTNGVATWRHFDHLGSVRAITDATGAKVESAIYRPFGEQSEWLLPGNVSPETKGWIGERFDADAGLQYLNARYYDPALGLFLQPDWFEVTKTGVGTNRFSYSFNDPVNKIDPGGNETEDNEVEIFPYTGANGTKAHEVLASHVEQDEDYVTEDGTYRAEQRIFGGIFDDIYDWLNGRYKGQPDASVRTGQFTAKFFDWKPVTHRNNVALRAKDSQQQGEWKEKALLDGLHLDPANTDFVTNGKVAGKIVGEPDENGTMPVYDVVTYSSETPGVAYYELRRNGFVRTMASEIARDIANGIQNLPKNFGPMPVPSLVLSMP